MSTAKIKSICKTCGKSFEIKKECFCKAAAESYESYAEDYFSECKSCYAVRMKNENADKASVLIAKYNLPEIHGVTAKQIAYANYLRNRWLAEWDERAIYTTPQKLIEKYGIYLVEDEIASAERNQSIEDGYFDAVIMYRDEIIAILKERDIKANDDNRTENT